MVNVGTISQQVLHVKGDIVFALESVARGSLPPDGIMSREMITLYIFMLTMSVIALKPCRVWLYKVLDTCVALLLLGLIGAVVLGIPFAITYLSFRGVWYVCMSLFHAYMGKA